jgi:predicted MFS family arabinose efflux permease
LFGLDAFAGGFVIQSIVAYWFHIRFGVDPATLGGIFFGANILAGISGLAAAWIAARIGLVNTMVFTHLPSNILLFLVPLMPNLPLAIAVLLLRFSVSQMDVTPRQSYTMAVVAPDERSAAAGVTGIARTIGASLSPALAGLLISNPALLGAPFFVAVLQEADDRCPIAASAVSERRSSMPRATEPASARARDLCSAAPERAVNHQCGWSRILPAVCFEPN